MSKREEYLSDLTGAERLHEDGFPLDGEPIKTDDTWCFDCDSDLDECDCNWDGGVDRTE